MRIGIVHSFYRSKLPSGENIAVLEQMSALQRAGHTVELFSQDSDVAINRVADKVKAGFRVATGFGIHPIEAVESSSVEVIHVHNLFPNWSTHWLKSLKVPYVASVHNFRYVCASGTLSRNGTDCDLCPKSGTIHSLIHRCYQDSVLKTLPLAISTRKTSKPLVLEHAARIVFLSERSASTFKNFGLEYPEKSAVVPNFSKFQENSWPGEPLSNRSRWLFVGRLSVEKGILPLIHEWPNGRALLVVGDGPLRASCESAAAGKDIAFAGYYPQDEIKDFLRSSIGLVFPSQVRENSPLTYLEALSYGLPTISLRENSVGDDIVINGCGVALSSLKGLEEALEEIERNYASYRTASRTTFKNFYSEQVWVSNMEKIYREALL